MSIHKCETCPRGENCVCEDTCSLDERCNCDIYQNLPEQSEVKAVKNREPKHLPWYKTQFWGGFIFGCQLGLLAGLPFAFVLYWVAVKVVHFIEGTV